METRWIGDRSFTVSKPKEIVPMILRVGTGCIVFVMGFGSGPRAESGSPVPVDFSYGSQWNGPELPAFCALSWKSVCNRN
jgi:hypothetical protein